MAPEQQRIAIAEVCGWTNIEHSSKRLHSAPFGNIPKVEGQAWTSSKLPLPDYLNDLNAMHEAENVLHGWQQGTYWKELDRICRNPRQLFFVAHATAAQRAEAFLRTFNLWAEL